MMSDYGKRSEGHSQRIKRLQALRRDDQRLYGTSTRASQIPLIQYEGPAASKK